MGRENNILDQSEINNLNALDMPSLTTVAFFIIASMAFQGVAPLSGGFYSYSNYSSLFLIVMAVLLTTSLFLISLRLFFMQPEQLIRQYNMQLLEKSEPDLGQRIAAYAREMGLRSCPLLLVTKTPGIPIQSFGTFRRHFVVVNQRELDLAQTLKEEDALEAMFIHELAHFKHGDVWKLRLAQKIISVFVAFSLIIMFAGIVRPTDLAFWFQSSPHDIWTEVAALLTYPVLVLAQFLMLKMLQDIRELHADARVVQVKGNDTVLKKAIIISILFWKQDDKPETGKIKRCRPNFGQAFGLGFLVPQKSKTARRIDALENSVVLHQSVHWAIVASGFAIGTSWLSVSSLLDRMSVFLMGGLLLVSTVYLLPRVSENKKANLNHVIRVVGYFLVGYFSCWALAIILTTAIYLASDAYYPLLLQPLSGYLFLAGLALIDIAYVVLSLLLTVPIIRWLIQAKRSGSLPKLWWFGEGALPSALALGIIALLSGTLYLIDSGLRGQTFLAFGIGILILLIAGSFMLLALIGRQRNAE